MIKHIALNGHIRHVKGLAAELDGGLQSQPFLIGLMDVVVAEGVMAGAGSAHTAVALDAGSIAGDGVQGIGSGAASAPAQLAVLHQDALALRRDGENVPPRVEYGEIVDHHVIRHTVEGRVGGEKLHVRV